MIDPDTPYGVVDNDTGEVVYKTTYKNRNKARSIKDKKDLKHGKVKYSVKVLEEESMREGSMKKTSRFKEGDKVEHKEEKRGVGTVVSRSGDTVGVRWPSGQESHNHGMLRKTGVKEGHEDPLSYWNDEEEPYDYDGNEDDLDYELRDRMRAIKAKEKEEREKKSVKEVNKGQKKELKKISKELSNASKMHKGQSDRISDLLDKDDEKEDIEEGKAKNCGCGQDPCVTYGIAEELENPEKADLDKDGELSSYEKKRGKAIEKSMKKKKDLKETLYESRDSKLYQKLLKKWTKK